MATTAAANEIKLSMLELNSQIMQGTTSVISNIGGLKKQTNPLMEALSSTDVHVYAKKGDSKYKEEIDINDDGTITFNEYVKYINEQNFSTSANDALKNLARYTKTQDDETKTETITIQNIGKAIRSYMTNSILLPQGKINTEA